MPSRLIGMFGVYDFLGKSVPGAVLFAGIISLLPTELGLENGGAEINGSGPEMLLSPLDIIALILLLLIAGVIFGQSVHTLATIFERIIAWVGDRVAGTMNVIADLLGSMSPLLGDIQLIEEPSSPEPYETGRWRTQFIVNSVREFEWLFKRILYNWKTGIEAWCYRRYWGINDTFKRHRVLFKEEIHWYLSPYSNRRRADDVHITKQRFIDAAKDYFDLSNVDFRPEYGDQLYVLVMTELSSSDKKRATQMQVLYSFCRSMWVVAFIITGLYLILLIGYEQPFEEYGLTLPSYETLFGSHPLVLAYFPWTSETNALALLVVLGLVTMLFFMAGTSIYKKHFIEYVFADFYTLVEQRENASEARQEDVN